MRKAIVYETSPFMTDSTYWTKGLSVACNVNSGGSPTLTPRLVTLWVRQKLLEHGFSRVDTSFCWSSSCSDPLLSGYFSNGVSIISYRGWAGSGGWYCPSFDQSSLNSLPNNNKLGIMASLVCGTGAYGADCFGETWINMGMAVNNWKGGPCFYGVSDYGTHTKWNNPIMVGYYWAILENGIDNFATAAFAGKVELFNTYPSHNYPGSYVEQYFNTYNTLGDPELEVRTKIPRRMTVTHPATAPVGTSLMAFHAVGNTGQPLVNAYVNLVKGYGVNEEVFVGGRTDSNGDITLDFATTVADTMFVTVTARDYIPYRGYSRIIQEAIALNTSLIVLDDDNTGNSSGNSDGNANPGENIEFDITLRNFGNATTATNVNATLVSNDPRIQVTVGYQAYGTILPGGTANSGKYAVHLNNDIPQGDHVILSLNISSDQISSAAAVPVDIKSILFAVQNLSYPNNPNNRFDPGETSQFVVDIINQGELAGTSLTGILTAVDTGIVIIDGTADFGTIGINGSGSNAGSPFVAQISQAMYHGHNVNFNLQMTSGNGSVTNRVFSAVVGNINTYDPLGPDNYGYYMYDNSDGAYTPTPTYNWTEISPYEGGSGTRIHFPFSYDDDAVVINLPFNFVYYGQTINYALVSINGFIAFDTSRYDMQGHHWTAFDNNNIPEPGAPRGLIGVFWDDLEYTNETSNQGVFSYYDAASHRLIIEWKSCYHPLITDHPETFEMIIYDPVYHPTPTGDAEIVFQYHTVYNDDHDDWDGGEAPGLFSTVGMQNWDNNDGLQYTFDNLYHPAAALLQAGRAIKITTATGLQPPPDIAVDPASFQATANVGQTVTDTLSISNISGGLLTFSLNEIEDSRLAENGGSTITAIPEPLGYSFDESAKPGDKIQPIYPPVILNSGGPDNFGNAWIDSDEPGGPSFYWVDISGIGTEITSFTDDNFFGPVDMGMTFSFYGTYYSQVYIVSNGLLSFGASTNSWSNQGFPNSAEPNNIIAMLWDDLNFDNGGTAYFYHDVANSRFIVSYHNVPFYSGGGDLTFQVILYGNGRILMQYSTLDGGTRGLDECSVGMENSLGDDGLQMTANADYLHNNMAILITPPATWLSSNIHGGNLTAGNDTLAIITFDASSLPQGIYTGRLDIESNDPDESNIQIPVNFNVGAALPPNIVETPANLADTLQSGNSAIHYLKVKNTGQGPLIVSFSDPANWISISPGPFAINPGDSLIHPATLNAVGLTPGAYNSNILTSSNDPDTPNISTPVYLFVTAAPEPEIEIFPLSLADTLVEGNLTIKTLIIRNIGQAPLIANLEAVELNLMSQDGGPEILTIKSGQSDLSATGAIDDNIEPPSIQNTWLFVNPINDTIPMADILIAQVTLTAVAVVPAQYNGRIAVSSNDVNEPILNIPVTLLVISGGGECQYIPGDANGNGSTNGLDVTFMVNYLKGGPMAPPDQCNCPPYGTVFVAADANGNCSFNGLDVTYLVNYLKGGPNAPDGCPSCPPGLTNSEN